MTQRMLDRRLSVAPMMDYTDRHCRYLLRLLSPRSLLYTEMVTAHALVHGHLDRLLGFDHFEHPVALQLGGSDPELLARAAKLGEQYGYHEINLNVGCPSDRVQSGRFGACLMAEPEIVAECMIAMREAVSIPVTVKCRIGIDELEDYGFFEWFVLAVRQGGRRRVRRACTQRHPAGPHAEGKPRDPAAALRRAGAAQARAPRAHGDPERRHQDRAAGARVVAEVRWRDDRPAGLPRALPARRTRRALSRPRLRCRRRASWWWIAMPTTSSACWRRAIACRSCCATSMASLRACRTPARGAVTSRSTRYSPVRARKCCGIPSSMFRNAA